MADLIQLARQRKVERAGALPGNEDLVERWTAALNARDGADDDLSKLNKAALVERAEAAGIDTDGKTKADLIHDLEGDDD